MKTVIKVMKIILCLEGLLTLNSKVLMISILSNLNILINIHLWPLNRIKILNYKMNNKVVFLNNVQNIFQIFKHSLLKTERIKV